MCLYRNEDADKEKRAWADKYCEMKKIYTILYHLKTEDSCIKLYERQKKIKRLLECVD